MHNSFIPSMNSTYPMNTGLGHSIHLLTGIVLAFLLHSCAGDKEYVPDVSGLKTDFKVVQTEKDIFFRPYPHTGQSLDSLKSRYPGFYGIYFQHILPLYTGTNNDSLALELNAFVRDSSIAALAETVRKSFGEMGAFNHDFDQYFRYLKYYFPAYNTPDLYTCISEFAYQVFVFEAEKGKDGIGIGLDMFLGPEYNYKAIAPDNPAFSDYLTRTWDRNHIVRKVNDVIVYDLLDEPPGLRLLDQMLWHGKALYITNLLMPMAHDSIILEYTSKQVDWCKDNELEMWAFFLDQNLIYETNPAKITKYISPAPNSPGMPEGAPGRTANYIGWKIIDAYMKRYPDTSLNDLINMKDSQEILDKSKYKPRRK